jgi:hypothetical protein
MSLTHHRALGRSGLVVSPAALGEARKAVFGGVEVQAWS